MARCWTCILLILVVGVGLLTAQVERVLPRKGSSSLEGTEFLVGFMQNERLEFGVDPRLQIFISSQYDAIVTIEYPLFGPQIRRVAANTVFVEDVSAYHVVNASEVPTQKGIFIRSNVPIVVYTLNTLAASTDSYTAIPIKHLGMDYLTVNRPNDRYPFNPRSDDPLDTMIRSSEFMIIAPNDYTNVEITPSYRTERGSLAGEPIVTTLYRGQCFLVRSAQSRIGIGDLTGSRIKSNLPVAVLSGHVRASVPTDSARSKDHLVEMLPPIPKWGKTYATTPFAIVYGGDVIRLMAGSDDTNIEIETPTGPFTRYLAKVGDWVDINMTEPAFYKSTKPFLVTQFMPSRRSGGSSDYDPAMVVVPPIEQYVDGALMQFPLLERQEQLGAFQNFYHFINVVAEDIAVPSLRVNDRLVRDIAPRILTQSIPGTNLKWAQVQLQPGSYTVTADSGLFSGVMYGSTNADSYANLIAVSYDPIPQDDRTPPVYALTIDCGEINGTVTDQGRDTARLYEVTVQTQRTFNYRWTIDGPTDSVGTRTITASVRDLWQDAQIVIHSYDHKGNGKEWLYRYDAPDIIIPTQIQIDARSRGTNCERVVIVNQDSTPVVIRSVSLSGDQRLSLDRSIVVDTTVSSKDSLVLLVCVTATTNTDPAVGTVTVDLGCGRIKTIVVRSASSAMAVTRDHDFGPVRVGDTVCTDIPVINTGSLPVIVTQWVADTSVGRFLPELPTMPDTLLPGDTLWVKVCFTPDSLRSYQRRDSIFTDPDLGLYTTWTGRGIAPDVPDVIIDWGRRRVGTSHDTIYTLRNDGEASCLINVGTPVEASFTSTSFGGEVLLGGLELDDLDLRFTPDREGPFSDTILASVDWRYHPVVRIILRGEGTLPKIAVQDLDMGDVVIGTRRDSTVDLLFVSGTEEPTIFNNRITGPDDAAFVLPTTLLNTGRMLAPSQIGGVVSFTPDRLGPFRMAVILEHDAAPGTQRLFDTINIIGRGIPVPVKRLDVSLDLDVYDACEEVSIPLLLRNTGTLPFPIDSILVQFADQMVSVPGLPLILMPGEQQQLMVDVLPTRTTIGPVVGTIYHADTVAATFRDQLDVRTPAPTITLQMPGLATPGSVVQLRIVVTGDRSRDTSEPIRIEILAPPDRLQFEEGGVPVVLQDASQGTRSIGATVQRTQGGILLDLSQTVTSQYSVDATIDAIVLWKDMAPTSVSASVVDNFCGDAARTETSFSVDQCADDLRRVRFGALPLVRASVVQQPSGEDLSLRFESTLETSVKIQLFDLSGHGIVLASNFTLQKGISHCKFSCSGRATGFYNLVVTYENGEEVLPVVIVN